jgi:CheY-like chemotaxis protein
MPATKFDSKILIVEDEPQLRQAFLFLLMAAGYQASSAGNGKEALLQLKAFQPTIILLDLMMPVMNGIEFLEALKQLPEPKSYKIVILSNLSDRISKTDAARYGVEKILVKANLAPDELLKEIATI